MFNCSQIISSVESIAISVKIAGITFKLVGSKGKKKEGKEENIPYV